jgi:hypothetical protein
MTATRAWCFFREGEDWALVILGRVSLLWKWVGVGRAIVWDLFRVGGVCGIRLAVVLLIVGVRWAVWREGWAIILGKRWWWSSVVWVEWVV